MQEIPSVRSTEIFALLVPNTGFALSGRSNCAKILQVKNQCRKLGEPTTVVNTHRVHLMEQYVDAERKIYATTPLGDIYLVY
jgi:hypothetical protein